MVIYLLLTLVKSSGLECSEIYNYELRSKLMKQWKTYFLFLFLTFIAHISVDDDIYVFVSTIKLFIEYL